MRIDTRKVIAAPISGLILCFAAVAANAQSTHTSAAHAATDPAATSSDTAQLQQELSKLRDQMRQLEQRLQSSSPSTMSQGGAMGSMKSQTGSPMRMGGMRMMEGEMGMPMKDTMPGSSMPMPAGGMGMEMMKRMEMMHGEMNNAGMMGMGAMGGSNSPAAMATPSALPGFPGQSHLYHIGATGFFLDHPEHIALSTQQQQTLAQRKQQTLLKQGELQRQIDAAEQELWQITGADQPQIGEIDKKVREIERLRGDRRIAFIRAVGESAKVLTDEQRKQLTGTAPAQSMTSPEPMPMPDSNTPKSNNMDHK